MSSTVPADKTFTPRQRAVYEIQNAMHLESVKALRPGIPYMKVYELSAQVMVEGLKELGLMKGNAEDAVREGAHALVLSSRTGPYDGNGCARYGELR